MFLYFRMICVMGVSLYTVRVTLDALGVIDYGVYQTIGGIVGMLAFLNSALGTGSSRFLTFELGRGITPRLRQTFSTLLLAHIIIAGLVVIVAELVGVWYLEYHLHIAAGQEMAAMVVFQLSVLTAVMSMTQIPYMAVIIAHEQMRIYAYVTLIEVILKLVVAFAITMIDSHRLEAYAILLCIVQVTIMGTYRLFCYRNYEESHFDWHIFDKDILREVGTFSGWSIFAQLSIALMNQGTLLLLNTFFSPAVVSARVIALQVCGAAQQFLNNFRTAANPQIVKRLAAGDFLASERLLLRSTYFSYYLMLLLALPILLLAEPLLELWLSEVPEYAVAFLQWSMVQSLFAVFDASLYTALYAKGRLRENALLSPTIGFIIVPVQFLLFELGYSPMVMCYLSTLTYAILGLIIKPYLVYRVAGYSLALIGMMFLRCLKVTIVAVPLVYATTMPFNIHAWSGFWGVCVVSLVIMVITSWCIGMDRDERDLVLRMIRDRLHGK
jgi:O-antigen/teichoic acid export membrane protein